MNDQLVDAVVTELQNVPQEYFTKFDGGWGDRIGTALADAVYSKQMVYETKNGKGLLPRLLKFNEIYPDATRSLATLASLSEGQLAAILGHGKTNGRTKASAVLKAASNLKAVGVIDASDYDAANTRHRDAYTAVHGLGPVTCDYFGMLLGTPDFKVDTWIRRFTDRVADEAGLARTDDPKVVLGEARTHGDFGTTDTHLDHAVWLYERTGQQAGDGRKVPLTGYQRIGAVPS